MTKPKDPSDDDPEKTGANAGDEPKADPAGKPIDVVIEGLATFAAKLRGLEGAELKRAVLDVVSQASSAIKHSSSQLNNDATRKAAEVEVERIIDFFARVTQGVADTLGPHRDTIASIFRSLNLDKIAEALRLMTSYMQAPTPENEERAKQFMKELQGAQATTEGDEPTDEDEAQRAQLRTDLKTQLDKIFKAPTDKKLN